MDSLCEKAKNALTKQSISKYEAGKMMPDSKSLIVLANALGVSIDYFFRPLAVSIENVEFRKKKRLGLKKIESIKAIVKEINGTKIALSLKFDDTNPWIDAEKKYVVGNVVTGKIARMTDFGAFVELEPGIDALLHVSQISRTHVEKPSDMLKVGDEIEAQIVDFSLEDKKISLSKKVLEPEIETNEEKAEEVVEAATEATEATEE